MPDLTNIDLSGLDLSQAQLTDADMSGVIARGVKWDNVILTAANLSKAKVLHSVIKHSSLFGGIFSDADFAGCEFLDCQMMHSNFHGASFTKCILISSDVKSANFHETDFSDARLVNVHFYQSELRRTCFQRSAFTYVNFSDCDLSAAEGLDTVLHDTPTSLGLDTIYRSGGRISEPFLRNSGVPDGFITQMRSLVSAEGGIEFYSCFISYSSRDGEFAKRLHGRMRDAHLRVWFAPEDMKSGEKLHEQIETAIRVFDKLLIVLSRESMRSEWVLTELRKAFKAEKKSGRRKLFPVRLCSFDALRYWECFDADSGKDLATELREYFIPDFSNWKDHDSFEAAFARLLKDLRAEKAPRATT
jgi:uncharacterized protein YjbI with pentapeptide repeats